MMKRNEHYSELSISFDHAIVESKPPAMMGNYNRNYLNQRERDDLETDILPYGLTTINTDQPTRISNKSGSLIDYIITDHYNAHSFSSFVSDNPFRTNKPIDRFVTSVISNIGY